MAEKKLATKSERVSVSKRKLAKNAEQMEQVAVVAAIQGQQEAQLGAARVAAAADMAGVGAVVLAKGASDLTRAEDAQVMAERMSVLSDVVAVAGVVDMAEGAEMLAASDDVDVMSALVGMMSEDDLDHGLELARLSGELKTVGEIVASMRLPVLADFLADRSGLLHEWSVEQIRSAISADGVSQIMAAAGEKVKGLGENEFDEGLSRVVVSEVVAEKSAEMEIASQDLAMQGIEEIAVAQEVADFARAEAKEGVAEISTGSAVVGAALALDEVANQMKEKSE